jgi:hypothetical protein
MLFLSNGKNTKTFGISNSFVPLSQKGNGKISKNHQNFKKMCTFASILVNKS